MKQTKALLSKIFKKCPQKAAFTLLLIAGLYSQVASAQANRREEGNRRETPNRQSAQRPGHVNQNARVHPVVRANATISRAPVTSTTTINRTNINVNRNNTTINRRPVNRAITTNRTVNNRVTVNNNYRRPVYNAGNPNWRYATLPRRNSIRTTFPTGYRTINYGGFGYRYYNGVFYRPQNNAFIVVAPPIGIFINTLPLGYRRIYVHNYPYYYYNGTYYDYRDNNYTVVSPPVGAVVESLPDGYQTVVIDGETYYTVDGAQYKPVVQDNGEIWYEVIKAN